MPGRTILIIQEDAAGGLVLLDAGGTQHAAGNPTQAWILLKQILANPDLPEVEQVPPGNANLEDAVTTFVEGQMPPGLAGFARPAVEGLLQSLRRISRDPRS